MEAGLSNPVDIVVVVIYFVLVLFVGLLSTCRKERDTVKGYFLAGRSMLWFPIGASLFASNIGSEHFIGLAGSGAASGIAVVAFEWGAAICLPLLGWVFLPVYLTSGLFTIPEYLSKRFGGNRLRIYLSLLALFLYIVTKISVDIYAGAVFVQQALGWNTYISIVALLAVTAVYTVVGGLAAVIFTDSLQAIIMLVGATVLAIIGFTKVGGIYGLMTKYPYAIPESPLVTNFTNASLVANYTSPTCGLPRKDAFHILRNAVSSDLPWPGVLIRSTFVSTWYWCADQVIVQRALAAKNIGHARGATLMAGYLKFLPLFIIIMPGMISRVLYPDLVACNDADTCMKICENPAGCSNVAYPRLILCLAPTGMRGLMMAVMMAALMSSLTSIFNSAATLFTMDLWKKIRKLASERELLIVGKVFVVILVGISVAWIPLIQAAQQGQLFLYIQAVTGYLAPPICSVFLLAIFVPRVNEKGAFWGMVIGQVIGLIRMILDFIYPSPKCGDTDTRPDIVSKVHFTYFASMVLIITAVMIIIISLFTEAPDSKQLEGLTFWTSKRIGPPPKEIVMVDLGSAEKMAQESSQNLDKSQELDKEGKESNIETSQPEIDGALTQENVSKLEKQVEKHRSELDGALDRIIKQRDSDIDRAGIYEEIEIDEVKPSGTSNWQMKESPVVMHRKSRDSENSEEKLPTYSQYVSDESRVMEVYGLGRRKSAKLNDDFQAGNYEPSAESVEQRNKIIRVKQQSYAADMSLVIHNELVSRKGNLSKVKPKPAPASQNSEQSEEPEVDGYQETELYAKVVHEPHADPPVYTQSEEVQRNSQSETETEKSEGENPIPESERNNSSVVHENHQRDSLETDTFEQIHNTADKTTPPVSPKKIRAPPPPTINKLYISNGWNLFLNINAVILICVFLFLYIVFH